MAMNTNSQLLGEKDNADWIRQALFVPQRGPGWSGNTRAKEMHYAGQFSYSTLAFADTSLGGNRSMNPKPQFTRFADPNLPSLLAGLSTTGKPSKTETMGMGRYYAEAIDANAQRIYMQFGVPAYNSLTNFFSTFYDSGHGNMANSGDVSSDLLYTIGKYVGFITFWAIIPELCIASFLYGIAKKFVADFQYRPLSKFYYMKPAMPLYWSTVTTIVNALCVNMKLVQDVAQGMADRPAGQKAVLDATKFGQSKTDIAELSKILPDIMLNGNGGIDIRAVANRYQRLADAHERAVNEIRNSSTSDVEAAGKIKAYLSAAHTTYDVKDPKPIDKYMADYVAGFGTGSHLIDKLAQDTPNPTGAAAPDTSVSDAANSQAAGASGIANQIKNLWSGISQHLTDYTDYAIAELRDGSAFISFIVDWESHASESFSNSTRESDIASKMNETSRSARSKIFDLAGGNVGEGIIADTLESAVKGVGDLISGVASSIGFSGLAMLGGKAFVDIPEFWDSSTTSLPSSSYDIQLRTPYGNPISILNSVLIPAAMLIAGAAPRNTGRNSYTGPFLCKLWQKGRTQIQLGMITSLTLTRGSGNVGWNIQEQPIGIDVNFTVTNLSKLLYVPITTDLSASDLLGLTLFDEDTNFTDYMAVLGSLGLSEQYYASSRWRLRRANVMQNFSSFLSVDNFLTWGAQTGPGSILGIFARQATLGA